MPTSAWHEGHQMGGYLNLHCAECRREAKHEEPWLERKRRQATEQGWSDEFTAGYISAIDEALAASATVALTRQDIAKRIYAALRSKEPA